LTLSPGAKVRVVESEKERGASAAIAGTVTAANRSGRRAPKSGLGSVDFRQIDFQYVGFR
jgi:hypothetical protein